MRAGMTRAKIADADNAATKRWLSLGAGNFSIRAAAMALFFTKRKNAINSMLLWLSPTGS